MPSPTRSLLLSLVVVMATGCAATGPYVWARDLKPEETGSGDYVIVPGDSVSIKVYNQEPLSTKGKVRSDGKISVPFLGDVLVAGKTPTTCSREMEAGLKNFINAPNVTVSVDDFNPTTISVVGEVGKPATIAIERGAGVIQAIAGAGGLTENASKDDIYVLRELPTPRRIRFTWDQLVLYPPAQPFRLRSGDIVVVE